MSRGLSSLPRNRGMMTSGKIYWDMQSRDLVRFSFPLLFLFFIYPHLALIRGLLENVGVEISPIRLIRRIKNGLEIPGLKEALIKILQDFHLQISLLEGCREILDGDCGELGTRLARCQSSRFFMTGGFSSLLLRCGYSIDDVLCVGRQDAV